jgi:phospholipid/cholesterol/gamma-HCH transport system permease protein
MLITELGKYILFIAGMFQKPEKQIFYWRELMHQCSEIGWRSSGIVIIISIFIGAVSTIQTAYQLVSPLIPRAAIAQVVRETVLLEFSPTLVSVVLAGVVGSKITSELGNMRVSEQIDALEVMGVFTTTWLVLPKVIASLIMIPVLIVISAALGIYGGRLAGSLTGIIPPDIYDEGLLRNFTSFSVIFMLIKAYCFSFLIATISSYFGFYVQGGSAGIGRATTSSVICTSIAILFTDYVLSLLLLSRN